MASSSSLKDSEWDIALVKGKDDVVLILNPYCKECATTKLDILRVFPIEFDDAKELAMKYGVRKCRVKCECDKL